MAVSVTNQCISTAADRGGPYHKAVSKPVMTKHFPLRGVRGRGDECPLVPSLNGTGSRPVAPTVPSTDTGLLAEDAIAVT